MFACTLAFQAVKTVVIKEYTARILLVLLLFAKTELHGWMHIKICSWWLFFTTAKLSNWMSHGMRKLASRRPDLCSVRRVYFLWLKIWPIKANIFDKCKATHFRTEISSCQQHVYLNVCMYISSNVYLYVDICIYVNATTNIVITHEYIEEYKYLLLQVSVQPARAHSSDLTVKFLWYECQLHWVCVYIVYF